MLGSFILETTIGLTILFLFLAFVTSAIREFWATWNNSRGKFLRRRLRTILRDNGFSPDQIRAIMRHPAVFYRVTRPFFLLRWTGLGVFNRPRRHSAYIAPQALATAMLDVLAAGWGVPRTYARLANALENPFQPGDRSRLLLRAMFREGERDLAKVEERLQQWVSAGMDRITGAYKTRARYSCLGIAIGLAIVFQLDTIDLAKFLWQDAAVNARLELVKATGEVDETTNLSDRTQTTERAKNGDRTRSSEWSQTDERKEPGEPPKAPEQKQGAQPAAPTHTTTTEQTDKSADQDKKSRANTIVEKVTTTNQTKTSRDADRAKGLLDELTTLNLASLWLDHLRRFLGFFGFWALLSAQFGCLITAAAASFAAPFWFQLLQKLVDFKGAGPEPKPEGASAGRGPEALIGMFRGAATTMALPVAVAAAAGGALAVTGSLALAPGATVKLEQPATVRFSQADLDRLGQGLALNWDNNNQVKLAGGGKITIDPDTITLKLGSDLSSIGRKLDTIITELETTGRSSVSRGAR